MIQMCFNGYMDKLWYLHIEEYYSATKKGKPIDASNMDGFQKHYTKSKKPDTKDYYL